MKFLVLLSVACAVFAMSEAFTAEQRKELEDRLIAECAGKEKITDADLAEVKARKMPSTTAAKCFHACVSETLGFVKDGVLHLDTVVDMAKMVFNDEVRVGHARTIATECGGITDSDRCELSFKMMTCGVETAKKIGISFQDLF